MKKTLLSLVFIIFIFSIFSFSNSEEVKPFERLPIENGPETKARMAEEKFENLYNSIDFGVAEKPAYQVFRKGFIGYLNLAYEKKISNKQILTLIDFSLPSIQKRLWIIDLKNKKLLFHDLVAHGKNSGENMATKFSNIRNSNMSSLGFYVTGQKYIGKHGLSLRLNGQDIGYNDKALERAVVMHGADYVNEGICKSMGRLGRSFGCPAVSMEIYQEVIETVAEGSCLFIFYPDADYLRKSRFLYENTAVDFFLSPAFGV